MCALLLGISCSERCQTDSGSSGSRCFRTRDRREGDILGSNLPTYASWWIGPDPEGVPCERIEPVDSIDVLLLDLVETIAINGELHREMLELGNYLNPLLDW